MIFGFARKKNIFLLQHYHPIRHIHCQIAASEFLTDFDSWDMLTIICSRSTSKPNFMLSLLGKRGKKVYINGTGHMTKMAATTIYGKNFKNLLLQNCPMIMKLGTEHYVLKLFESYMNDDPELTLSYFTTISNSEKTCFCSYCRPRYQVSIYRTIGPLVCFCFNNNGQTKNSLTLCNVFISHFCFIRCFYFCCGSKHYSIK